MAATDRDSGPTRHESDPAEATVPGPIARVDRRPAAARDWYDRLSRWYDLVADPFEAPARAAGLDLLAPEAGERILDVGCGTGSALVRMARDVAPDGTAIGLNVADGMCHTSQRELETAGSDSGTVIAGDATLAPFRNGAFDAVFASFVLELFDTPSIPDVLAEWRRILAAGGLPWGASITPPARRPPGSSRRRRPARRRSSRYQPRVRTPCSRRPSRARRHRCRPAGRCGGPPRSVTRSNG